jgi:hypothetical protein
MSLTKRDNTRWGPELKYYLLSTQDRIATLSEKYSTTQQPIKWPTSGTVPLQLLETLVVEGDNINHVQNYMPGKRSLPMLFDSLEEYLRGRNNKVCTFVILALPTT